MSNPNELFEQYVEHSYRYYQLDDPVIPDCVYDELCARLLRVWDQVDHPDKNLTDESALEAGSGFQMWGKWPAWAKARVE